MAAAEMSVFFPSEVDKDSLLVNLVESLQLVRDDLQPEFPYDFSAQRRHAGGYILIEFDSDIGSIVSELRDWEKPSASFKELLSNCASSLVIHYRGIDNAKACLLKIAETLGVLANQCVVENGEGCLLNLADVVRRITDDKSWTWERKEFPEFDGVASSEWLD